MSVDSKRRIEQELLRTMVLGQLIILILIQTNSKILKDPCFIFPIVILKFKVTANMNTYDYPLNTKTIKNYLLNQKIMFTMPKQLKIGKILDNCFSERDFF